MTFESILTANSPSTWMTAWLLPIGITLLFWLAKLIVIKRFRSVAEATDNFVDDVAVDVASRINLAIVFIVSAFFSFKILVLPDSLSSVIRGLTIVVVFLQVAIWGNSLISLFLIRARERGASKRINASAQRAISYLGRAALWTLIGALLLENLGIHLNALLAGIGIGGIAIALAAQNVLGDIFCYVAIILDKPFIAGDFLIVGDLMGSVERIGIKTTRVRSLSGEQLVFSNHDLVNSRIQNYETLAERRVVFTFGIIYELPTQLVESIPNIVDEVISSHKNVRFDRAHFAKFGDFSLDFEVVYYVLDPDYKRYMDIQQQINLGLMRLFKERGIEFAYPTQLLHLRVPGVHSKLELQEVN